MGIGVGIFLIAVGAVLTFALETEVSGIDLDTVGIILMAVGALGVLASMLFFNGTYGLGRRSVVADETYVAPAAPAARTVVREERY